MWYILENTCLLLAYVELDQAWACLLISAYFLVKIYGNILILDGNKKWTPPCYSCTVVPNFKGFSNWSIAQSSQLLFSSPQSEGSWGEICTHHRTATKLVGWWGVLGSPVYGTAFEILRRKAGDEKHVLKHWNFFVPSKLQKTFTKVHLNENQSSVGLVKYCKYDLEHAWRQTN